jgi:glycosyltransferase involved in cell wall biosynthesis
MHAQIKTADVSSSRGDAAPVTFSVVAPVYDEEDTLPLFYHRVTAVMERLAEPYELLLVDDGSRDASLARMRALVARDPRVRVLRLSRNFGHQPALSAGLDFARGQAVILLDSDLQDPPEVIPELVARWRQGAQVVYGQRIARRGESAWKLLTAATFYRLMGRVSDITLPPEAGDFRLLDRRVVDVLTQCREQHRFLRGLSAWVGFTQVAVPYERAERAAGTTKYPLRKMLRLAVDAVTGFSLAPLQLATLVGTALLAVSLLAAVVAVILWLLGITSLSAAGMPLLMLFLGGIQLISVGILGEYLGRIYDEVRDRPRYIVGEVLGGARTVAQGDAATRPLPVPAAEAATMPHAATV